MLTPLSLTARCLGLCVVALTLHAAPAEAAKDQIESASASASSAKAPAKTSKAKPKKSTPKPAKAKADLGSAETTAAREKRLKRECKGRPDAGACLGFAS